MATSQRELDVSDLKDIIEVLKQGYFPNDRWSPLGLQLGLLQPTLSSIRTKYRDDPENCLQECLNLWLSKADNVTKSGGATLDSLASALEKIGEISTAEKIKDFNDTDISSLRKRKRDVQTMELEQKHVKLDLNTACQILQKHSDRLSSLTLPMEIVQMLYTERVISKETLDEVNRLGGVLGDGPLKAIHTTVHEDPRKLKLFASILLKSEQTVPVAKDILKEYDQTFSFRVSLQPTYQYDLDRMIVTFENLINVVSPLIKAGIPSLNNLKIYLRTCFRELRPQLATAESFDDVMDLVEDKCTIINVCCLEGIVNDYKITEAKSLIKEFKMTVDTFCENIKVSICLEQKFKFTHHVICETIEFILEWEVDKYTLKHIKDLLSKAFKDMAESVQVRAINERSIDKTIELEVRSNEATKEELKVVLQQKQREIDDLISTKEALEEELQTLKKKILEISSITESKESELKQLLETSTKMNRVKIVQIEQLTNTIKRKESTEKELLSVSAERKRELDILQEIVTSLTLQLRERDKRIEELKQSLKEMKQSNIEDFSSFLTEREVTIEDRLQEESTQSSERDKLIEELQQSVLLKALDLTVIPKAQNLSTIEGLKEMQTRAKEKDSTLSNSEKIGLLDNIQDKVNEQLQVSNEKCIQCDHWNSPNITDLFKGMVTVGKKVCLYKADSDHELTVEECGLRLVIPAEVIKPTEFVHVYEVAAQGLWGGKFEFPKGSKLISGVCYISVSSTSLLDKADSSVLDEAVTVELEHCATIVDETQSQYLSFVIADHKSGPPFKFKKLSGGYFFSNSQIGSISIKSFSIVAIVLLTVVGVAGDGMVGAVAGGLVGGVVGGLVSTAATATVVLAGGAFIGSKIERGLTAYHDVACSYKGHVFYKRENLRKWSCNFVVTQNTKYSDSLLEDFFGKIHYSFGFCFTKATLELKGFPSENKKTHGWTIIPHVIPTIIKVKDVDEFSSSEQAKPPSISMGITAHPDDSDFKEDFQYFLTVEGVDCGKEKNVKDFILGFIIPSQSKIVIDISLLSDNTHTILNTCPDENELLDLLASIDSDWYKIGKALKVSHNTLEGLRQNNESNTVRLEEVIHSWITTQSSPVTWQTVIDAIDGNIVNNRSKANEIREYLRLPN